MKFALIAPTFDTPKDFVHPTLIDEVAQAIGNMPPYTGGLSPHDRSRGFLQSKALVTSDADAFLWIDSDIGATPNDCFDLCTAFANLTKESLDSEGVQRPHTMTGIYICRHAAGKGEVVMNFNPRWDGEPYEIPFGEKGGIFPVTAHGFGFCVVSRLCLDSLEAPRAVYEGYPGKAWFLPMVVGGYHLGEDRSFTTRVLQQRGGGMFVDSRICVAHAGVKP